MAHRGANQLIARPFMGMSESHKSYFTKVARRLGWYQCSLHRRKFHNVYSASLSGKLAKSTVPSVSKERPPNVVLRKLAKLRLPITDRTADAATWNAGLTFAADGRI